MTYHLTLEFPKEKYSIDKNSNQFTAKDQEGNRFIMTTDNKQKGKISFCKDDDNECKSKQHYTVKDPKICNKLSDIDSADYISVIMEGYGEKYFQERILGGLNKYNIDYIFVVDEGETQNVLLEIL
ncbi:hypothetical protein Wcon_00741 [Wolbachia endosymbiont of Cylisticus convexus]|uniref:hypothetical protein n=1 Tax=Wolbachia endosymbiont of Cylisticus convexus TaxID=118728 RepID=UPI000DF7000D|nr:hypothetical protein [Wolbachia endosymbiont of Cylisticus convexus]RDD35116.1 hypothetical protein Wcon_00741 [Wolbachia endosymbiont of Cylisticus convexus]